MVPLKSLMTALAWFVLLTISATAAPDRLKVSIGSIHTKDDEGKFTPFNPGVFGIWDQEKGSVGAGVFRNSYADPAFAFVGNYPIWTRDTWDPSIFGALAWYPNGSRFDLSVGNWVPGLGLEIRSGHYFAQVFPSSDDIFDAVVTIGVVVPLSESD